jgi:hypothetical protein
LAVVVVGKVPRGTALFELELIIEDIEVMVEDEFDGDFSSWAIGAIVLSIKLFFFLLVIFFIS